MGLWSAWVEKAASGCGKDSPISSLAVAVLTVARRRGLCTRAVGEGVRRSLAPVDMGVHAVFHVILHVCVGMLVCVGGWVFAYLSPYAAAQLWLVCLGC